MSKECNTPEEALTTASKSFVCWWRRFRRWCGEPRQRVIFDYVNKRVLEYLGAPLSEVIGWGWMDKVHPDDVAFKVRNWLAKSRIRKSSRCSVQNSRSGRSISVVRGPRRTIASQRWHGVKLVRRSDRYR